MLTEAIKSHVDNFKSTLNTSIPAKVTAVNLDGDSISTVDVKPVVSKVFSDGFVVDSATISGVPLCFPSGGGAILSFPIKVGDTVLVIFSQADIQKWLAYGQEGIQDTLRVFSMTDAIAIPSVYPPQNNLQPNKDHLQLKYGDTTITMKNSSEVEIDTPSEIAIKAPERASIESGKVYIGNGSVEIVSFLSELTEEISKITVSGSPIDNLAAFVALKAKIEGLKV